VRAEWLNRLFPGVRGEIILSHKVASGVILSQPGSGADRWKMTVAKPRRDADNENRAFVAIPSRHYE
jgi:hypothetical protein